MPVLTGKLTLSEEELGEIADHYSLMTHFKNEVLAKWNIGELEYWDMLQEQLLHCPEEHLWSGFIATVNHVKGRD